MSDMSEWLADMFAQTVEGVDLTFMRSAPFPGASETWRFAPRDFTTPNVTLFDDEGDE